MDRDLAIELVDVLGDIKTDLDILADIKLDLDGILAVLTPPEEPTEPAADDA